MTGPNVCRGCLHPMNDKHHPDCLELKKVREENDPLHSNCVLPSQCGKSDRLRKCEHCGNLETVKHAAGCPRARDVEPVALCDASGCTCGNPPGIGHENWCDIVTGKKSQSQSLPRANSDKAPVDLVHPHVIRELAKVMGFGAQKYDRWNWTKGYPYSTCYGCALRHLFAWYEGEDTDPESGEHHLAHVIANAMMLLHYQREGRTQLDDRPSEINLRALFNAE